MSIQTIPDYIIDLVLRRTIKTVICFPLKLPSRINMLSM
jgi:hypothetical protein